MFLSVLIGACALICLVLIRLILNFTRTSLRAIPGPWHTSFTRIVLKFHLLNGSAMHYTHDLHQRYGPIVRIAPDEVSCIGDEAYRQIYLRAGKSQAFVKAPWYGRLITTKDWPAQCLFTTTDDKEAIRRRKELKPKLTLAYLRKNWESVVEHHAETAVLNIKADALAGSANIMRWWGFMTADIISNLCFGEAFGLIKTGNKNEYMEALEASAIGMGLRDELPWLAAGLSCLPLKSCQLIMTALRRVMELTEHAIMRSQNRSNRCATIFENLLAPSFKDPHGRQVPPEVKAEAAGLVLAGSDTTMATLTYAIWAVLRDEKVQEGLEAEIEGLESLEDVVLEGCPILSAVVQETLRLHSAIPASLRRTVPSEGCIIYGHYLAADVVVSAAAYSLHRDESKWQNATKFDPFRYLEKSAEPPMAAFGVGGRNCIGQDLAMMELRKGVALFFRHCKGAKLSNSTTDRTMRMKDLYVLVPDGGRCDVTLSHAD